MPILIDATCDSLIDGQELYRPGDLVTVGDREYICQRTITVSIMRDLSLHSPGEAAFRRYLKSTDNFPQPT